MNDKKYEELEINAVHSAVECFEKFIEFINVEKPILSAKRAMLGKNDCFKLNSILNFRKDVVAPNYTQDQYPIIDLMFHIALDGRLLIKSENKKGKPILAETPNLKQYQSLNEYEKYVYLLQIYWTKYDFKHNTDDMSSLSMFMFSLEGISNAESEKYLSERISYSIKSSYYHLEFFGFGSLILNEKKLNSFSRDIARFYRNDFGIKIGSFLKKKAYKYINDDIFRYFIQNSNLKGSKNLVDLSEENPFVVFKNIFPNKNVNKTVDPIDVLIDRSGAYLFKVSLKYESDTWRTIRLSHEHTLEDLHNAIQTAFDFDDDHLYAFYINGNSKTGREIKGCPFGGEDFFGEDEITSDKVTIGDLELYKGARIYYVFDFGDNWEFDIVVKEIDKNAPFPIDAEIVESKGKSPQQYRSWDDE